MSGGGAAARPDQRQLLAFRLDQARLDRSREGRIVQLHREVGVALSECFFHAAPNSVVPQNTRKSGPLSLSPSDGTNFTALTLRLRVLTEPVKPF